MTRWIAAVLAVLLLTGCAFREETPSLVQEVPAETAVETVETTEAPETAPSTEAPTVETEAPLPPIVREIPPEDQEMLLKIAMAELGDTQCEDCLALVICTVLNRVEAGGFGRSVYGVLHAPGQFTPVEDGSYAGAVPNESCMAALDRVLRGWDESQGALYYEFCDGPSWHSQNLTLLTEHCNTRFYK